MAKCGKKGCMAGVPSGIKMKDMRMGTNRKVATTADLAGAKPMMKDQRGMNQKKLNVKNPLNGKM